MANVNTKKQLLIKNNESYENIYPINYIINVVDFESGESLEDLIKRFNHVMVQITGTKAVIRANIPTLLRHRGLHISFMQDDKLYTEYYKSTVYTDDEWIKDDNWGVTINDNNNNNIVIDPNSITLAMLSKEVQDALATIIDIDSLQAIASAISGTNASANVTYNQGLFNFTFTLPKGDKGDKGDPFTIAKTYPSIDAMNAGFASDGVPNGGFVMIDTGSVEDPDNAKLYVKGTTAYTYITDLSGATGLKGDPGVPGTAGANGITPLLRNNSGYLQASYDNGSNWTNLLPLTDIKGDKGDKGDPGTNGVNGSPGANAPACLMRVDSGYIQYSNDGGLSYNNLIAISSLVGPAGANGTNADLTKAEIIARLNQAGECVMMQHWSFAAGAANTSV